MLPLGERCIGGLEEACSGVLLFLVFQQQAHGNADDACNQGAEESRPEIACREANPKGCAHFPRQIKKEGVNK